MASSGSSAYFLRVIVVVVDEYIVVFSQSTAIIHSEATAARACRVYGTYHHAPRDIWVHNASMGGPAGFVFAILAAAFNGCWVAFFKIPSVAKHQLHPVLFNLYVSVGVFISSWFVVPFFGRVGASVAFTWYGFLAGTLFVLAGSFSFIAAGEIGLSTGQGVWGGAAIVVSFLWGTLGPPPIGAPPKSFVLSMVAIALLLLGVVGIVKCECLGLNCRRLLCGKVAKIGTQVEASADKVGVGASAAEGASAAGEGSSEDGASTAVEVLSSSSEDGAGAAGEGFSRGSSNEAEGSSEEAKGSSRAGGLMAALAVGVFGGSILAPSEFAGAYVACPC